MTAAAPRHGAPLAGIACVAVGVLFLTISDAVAKLLGERYSPIQILFLRAAIALPFVAALATALGGRRALRTRHLGVHLLRGAINVVSACFFYLGLRSLPLATALLYAVMMVTARAIGRTEGMLTTMFYIVVAQAACSAVAVAGFWTPPMRVDLPYFAAVAFFSTLGLTFITQGFRIGPASTVAPFDYTGLLWASLLGWLWWHDVPGLNTCVGAVFIAGSGLYIAWRETRLRVRRGRGKA